MHHKRSHRFFLNKYMHAPLVIIFMLVGCLYGLVALIILQNMNKPELRQTTSIKLQLPGNNPLQQQAEKDIPLLIESILQEKFQPGLYSVSPTTDRKGKVINPNRYHFSWKRNKVSVNVAISYKDVGVKEAESINIIPQGHVFPLDQPSAVSTVGQYIIVIPNGSWQCRTVNAYDQSDSKATLCENFWIDSQQVKNGIGVLRTNKLDNNGTVFFCRLYPNTASYIRKSCTSYE